jgi:predicted kinase
VAQWLLFTCGYPFSGKSTLSAAIRDTFGFDLVSIDEQFTDSSVASWRDAYIAAYRALDAALSAGRSVVFDSVGHTRKHRDRLRRKAENASADSLVVWLCISASEADQRRQANVRSPIRAHVPDEGFDEIVGRFEPLGSDEAHLMYRPIETIASWIEQELRPIVERQD